MIGIKIALAGLLLLLVTYCIASNTKANKTSNKDVALTLLFLAVAGVAIVSGALVAIFTL